ncbi:MAG TPA: hypothetical protein VK464_15370 [Symbiobacteriaceae bacterium]|jgi:hypothetical protein|nr:hypothetical protein [Symbiobacteriaceae bacterium]
MAQTIRSIVTEELQAFEARIDGKLQQFEERMLGKIQESEERMAKGLAYLGEKWLEHDKEIWQLKRKR